MIKLRKTKYPALIMLCVASGSAITSPGTGEKTVCEVLSKSTEFADKHVAVVGLLRGGFSHGFDLFGAEHGFPCAKPEIGWLQTRLTVGAVLINFAAAEHDTQLAHQLVILEPRLCGQVVRVRVEGILRVKRFFFSLCPTEEHCFGNGYAGAYPAVLDLHGLYPLD